jgi:hypothetical protein
MVCRRLCGFSMSGATRAADTGYSRPEMLLAGHDFAHVCDIEPHRNADGTVRAFKPQGRYENTRGLKLHKYGSGEFCHFRIDAAHVAGVYALTVGGEVLYVGECVDLSARFNAGYGNISPRNCFEGGRGTNCRVNASILAAVQAGGRVSLWLFRAADRRAVEAQLRASMELEWNRV